MSTKSIKVPFLPQPRSITLNGSSCDVAGKIIFSTNVENPLNYDYLLSLAGMTCIEKRDIQTGDLSVLYIVLGKVPAQLTLRPESTDKEAYAIESKDETIIIAANTESGLSLGIKLIVRLQKAGMLDRGYSVQDYPDI
ncbi:MAG: hypothetical protein K6C13_05475, partial [Oscillospiraceae bacterium]|nr:hypothetical protein [Oscillospiraceae bacterium]